MRPLSPWDLARSADGFAHGARGADLRAAGASGRDGLLAVGGTVVLRSTLLLALAGLVATVAAPRWTLVLALVGILAPPTYAGLYLRASTPAAREVLLASLHHGYRASLFLLVVAAAVLVRFAGVRLGWVVADPPPAWGLAAGVAVVVAAQTRALRRGARRGPA